MKQRVITAVIALLLLAIVLFFVPPIVAQVVIIAVILAGAWEWSAFLGASGNGVRFMYVCGIGVLLAAVTLAPGVDASLVFKISMVWWMIAFVWTFFYPTAIPIAVRWIVGILILVPVYLALIGLYQAGPSILLFALLVIWVADSGAFFAGKTMGKVKLAPSISPGKTWEGVIGGLVAVGLLALVRSIWVETDLMVFVPFCLAAGCLSVIGDLTISMFKRNAGVKDSGTLFPGHGGVLDRIDSVAAAAPLFALGATWAGLK
ncbi:MAG: phosphatidate cytidylyltransferase [Woeseiaceae bacterium]|nr:phosphatidate cytidylyltransferase [Woeseiaceae bacterium]MDX2607726.1 phosphatidate cytidylyltransferase [Woeseiaceae bacterium]